MTVDIMDIKISVLATFYNIEKYVDECIESILMQKCNFDYEIIAGDDGSNDGTYEKLRSWQMKYPNIISVYSMERSPSEPCLGTVRASRNRLNLLKYVRGKYFCYLDGDDYYISCNKLQKQFDIMEAHPDYAACGHQLLLKVNSGETKLLPETSFEYIKDIRDFCINDYISTDALLFRSCNIRNIDMKLVADSWNDELITFIMLQKGKIFYFPEAMAVYRWTGEGIFSKESACMQNIERIVGFEIEKTVNPKLLSSLCTRYYRTLNYFCRYQGKQDDFNDKEKLRLWREVAQNNGLDFTLCCLDIISGGKACKELRNYYLIAFWGHYMIRGPQLLKSKLNDFYRRKNGKNG